jgi:uncharacterized membrane protein
VSLEQPRVAGASLVAPKEPATQLLNVPAAANHSGRYGMPDTQPAVTEPTPESIASESAPMEMPVAAPSELPPVVVEPALHAEVLNDTPPPVDGPFAVHREDDDAARADAGPSLWQRLFAGNIVAKVGVVILFFGVGFLLKYAYENNMLPVPLRLGAVAVAGFAMLFGGGKMLASRRLYGLILQGAGIGVLYLDVFFALRVYALVNPAIGFALFMALGVAATLLAVRQDAKVLAVLGLCGAFLAPVLAGTREGNHVMLFSYYTLLNAFILAISWFKSWRDLNLTGFIFTFVVGSIWGANNYRPEMFATVEPFVLIFFAMYLVIPILFASRQPPDLKGLVDGTLVFGAPLSTAFMQAALVRDMPYGLAWSAGCAAGLYALLALMVIRRNGLRLLGETYVALSVVFATMTIFFALDAYPTFALWTLEGTAIVWVGLRQRRLIARVFGLAVQAAGAAMFLLNYPNYDLGNPWFNDFVLGCLLIATAGIVTSWLMHRHREVLIEGGEAAAAVVLVWGCAMWFAGGLHALHGGVPARDFHAAAMIFTAASFGIAETAGSLLAWPALRLIVLAHLPALVLGMVTIGSRHPLAQLGAVAWPFNFIVFFWCLNWQRKDELASSHEMRYRIGWLLLAVLATWEAIWLLDHRQYGLSYLMGVLGVVVAWLRYRLRERDSEQAGRLSSWVLLWGLAFWFVSGWGYIEHHPVMSGMRVVYGLGFAAASCLLFEFAGTWLNWTALRRTQFILLPAMAVALFWQFQRHLHPFAGHAWMAWIAAWSAFYGILYRQRENDLAVSANHQHLVAVWMAAGLLAWECAWQLAQHAPATSWAFATWGMVPAAILFAIARYGRTIWPWSQDFAFFRNACLTPIVLYCVAWSIAAMGNPGGAAPLPYLPLLNPVDLAQVMVLAGLVAWHASEAAENEHKTEFSALLGLLGFAWLNSIVLRSVHHWAGIPYTVHDLFNSMTVQAAFSLLWTVTAMALMVNATRNLRRGLWIAGVALLAVVVGKLFLLDLANSGTIARIVSFLGVGGLIMLIGYIAPVPPGDSEKQSG